MAAVNLLGRGWQRLMSGDWPLGLRWSNVLDIYLIERLGAVLALAYDRATAFIVSPQQELRQSSSPRVGIVSIVMACRRRASGYFPSNANQCVASER
jgi:hypothetical protein